MTAAKLPAAFAIFVSVALSQTPPPTLTVHGISGTTVTLSPSDLARLPPSRGFPRSAMVESVAHLSIVTMESYALKELSDADVRRVEEHVATCPKCRFILEEQLGWAAAMRSPFRRKVEKMIEEERKKRRKAGTGGSVEPKDLLNNNLYKTY